MSQWYLSYNGQSSGPFDAATARAKARDNPNGHCWREGFAQWVPIADVAELSADAPAVPLPAPPSAGSTSLADVVDYKIFGSDMQFVEIELDPSESIVAEAGALFYKDSAIGMETVFGDGKRGSQGGGFMDKLVGAGKRLLTGESLFITAFTHQGSGKARAAFAAPYPGTIVPMQLSQMGGRVICQKDAFLCAARGVSIGIHFQKKILTGLFGGEGVFLATLTGPGRVWLQSLPFSRMAGRILQAAPQRGGSRDEGSVLGGLGGLLMGDRNE